MSQKIADLGFVSASAIFRCLCAIMS